MKVNPLSGNDPMNWVDAAIVSAVLTTGSFFTVFLTMWEWPQIAAQWTPFLYNAARFLGGQFMTNFIALTGLAQLAKRRRT